MRIAILIAATLGLAGFGPAGAAEPAAAEATVTIPIDGVGCASCTLAVRRALQKLDGVRAIGPGPARNEAAVTYDPSRVGPAEMVRAIESAGFKAGTPARVNR
jgi:copper chaperone CopZ